MLRKAILLGTSVVACVKLYSKQKKRTKHKHTKISDFSHDIHNIILSYVQFHDLIDFFRNHDLDFSTKFNYNTSLLSNSHDDDFKSIQYFPNMHLIGIKAHHYTPHKCNNTQTLTIEKSQIFSILTQCPSIANLHIANTDTNLNHIFIPICEKIKKLKLTNCKYSIPNYIPQMTLHTLTLCHITLTTRQIQQISMCKTLKTLRLKQIKYQKILISPATFTNNWLILEIRNVDNCDNLIQALKCVKLQNLKIIDTSAINLDIIINYRQLRRLRIHNCPHLEFISLETKSKMFKEVIISQCPKILNWNIIGPNISTRITPPMIGKL